MLLRRIERKRKLACSAPSTTARLDPFHRRQPVLSQVALSAVTASDGFFLPVALPRQHDIHEPLRLRIECAHGIDPPALGTIDEVVALPPRTDPLAVDLHLPLRHGRREFLE